MNIYTQYLLVFTTAYFQVFLLGLNSKLLRDDKVAAGFVVSWMITLAQFGYIWAVTNTHLSVMVFLIVSGFGGSIGITTAQYFYRWYDSAFHKNERGNWYGLRSKRTTMG